MKIGPPSRHIAKFIHQSEKKHLKFFKLYFKDCAKVWFKPEDYSIHFQALNAVGYFQLTFFYVFYRLIMFLCAKSFCYSLISLMKTNKLVHSNDKKNRFSLLQSL